MGIESTRNVADEYFFITIPTLAYGLSVLIGPKYFLP